MFRPCIDLHDGQVKQIVGGSLSDDQTSLRTNFVARSVSHKVRSRHVNQMQANRLDPDQTELLRPAAILRPISLGSIATMDYEEGM